MSDRLFQTVVTAGLLHDIGKFLQRGDFGSLSLTGKHPAISRDFINLPENKKFFAKFCDEELLSELVARHHESSSFPPELQVSGANDSIRPYAYMVSRADNYSSAERDDASEGTTLRYKKVALASVFSRLQLDKPKAELYSYRLERLSPLHAFPIKGNEVVDETPYKKHIKRFGEEFRQLIQDQTITSFETFYARIFTLLQNYTWCIPSSTLDTVPDVSLFDHLKTTSAIAAALFRYHGDSTHDITADGKKKFRLIVGDLSGIQKYIFRITTKGAGGIAKRLRARSFYLGIITDIVSHMLIDAFQLTLSNIVMASGGKFYVLAPNTPYAVDIINNIYNSVNQELFDRHHGQLALNLASVAFSGDDFEDFGKVMTDLSQELVKAKSTPFYSVLQQGGKWREDRFIKRYESDNGIDVCPGCGAVHADGGECDDCSRDQRMGQMLPRTTYISFFRDNPKAETILGQYGIMLDNGLIKHSCVPYLVYNLNEQGRPTSFPDYVKVMAKYVPLDDDGQSLSFDDIAQNAKGYSLLGCLKADVDNLGMLFSLGLKEDNNNYGSISRISTMSRMLELFFSGWIEQVLSQKYLNCYTCYSGGDDLLIVGPWNEIFDLCGEVNNAFKRFIAYNPNITLSAGVSLFKARYPIDLAVETAEQLLERAKEQRNFRSGSGRNQISIFGQTVDWSDYEIIQREGRRMASWLTEGKISSALLYRLRQYSQMYCQAEGNSGNGSDSNGYMFKSLLQYDISRNSQSINSEAIHWLKNLSENPGNIMRLLIPITTYALYANRAKGGQTNGVKSLFE